MTKESTLLALKPYTDQLGYIRIPNVPAVGNAFDLLNGLGLKIDRKVIVNRSQSPYYRHTLYSGYEKPMHITSYDFLQDGTADLTGKNQRINVATYLPDMSNILVHNYNSTRDFIGRFHGLPVKEWYLAMR